MDRSIDLDEADEEAAAVAAVSPSAGASCRS